MNLAQRIVMCVAAAGVALAVAAHVADYVAWNVDTHVRLVQHVGQALVAAAWGAFSYLLFRDRS